MTGGEEPSKSETPEAILANGPAPDAVAKVRADAARGVAAASQLLATLAGSGIGMPQSWSGALDHLAQAARDGSESARGQLEALGSTTATADNEKWSDLAASVPLAEWTAPRPKRELCASPRVVAIDGFLGRPVCDWLIGSARGRVKPAQVYDADGSPVLETGARSNSFVEFGVLNCDVVMLLVRQRIAAAIGVPIGALENSQVLHYRVGEEFVRHYDYLDRSLPDVAVRGQRVVTFLIYLNDDYEGGETEFAHLGLRNRGAAGDALYFVNLDGAGSPDPRTLHAGLPPTRGEKWLFSQWVRNRTRR